MFRALVLATYMDSYIHVSFVSSRSGDSRQGNPRRTNCAFVDGVATVRLEHAFFFRVVDHGKSYAVFGRISCTIEELGFG